ncbi:MAG: hypothetical protein AAF997_10495 [Myxococcota bacterium]
MSTRLREAATRRLAERAKSSPDGAVQRITMDIEAEGRVEMVTISLRNGELRCVSSDGNDEGPHVTAALAFVAGSEPRDDSQPPVMAASATRPQDPKPFEELADAIDELLVAVTRVGIDKARHAPSVDEALKRIGQAASSPMPPGLSRFIGRLRQEVMSGQPRHAARILDGAAQFADALSSDGTSDDDRRRTAAWLGAEQSFPGHRELLYDRTMLEVGREWLSGCERASVERRYLVDLETGTVYREDRPRHAAASLGPCPRLVHVGLAECESGPAPFRVRLLQYEVRPEVQKASWDRVAQVARRSFAQLTEGYRRDVSAYPALSEPFALVAPYRVEHEDGFVAIDSEGHQIALERTERRGSVLAFYELLNRGADPAWIAGRLTDLGTTLCISPFAVVSRSGEYTRL